MLQLSAYLILVSSAKEQKWALWQLLLTDHRYQKKEKSVRGRYGTGQVERHSEKTGVIKTGIYLIYFIFNLINTKMNFFCYLNL